MVITCGNKEYEVRFGLGFLRELNKKYFESLKLGNGREMILGIGLESRIPFILEEDPLELSDFLYFGTRHLKNAPKQEEIDEYIENCEDLHGLFWEVIGELKKANATSKKVISLIEMKGESGVANNA